MNKKSPNIKQEKSPNPKAQATSPLTTEGQKPKRKKKDIINLEEWKASGAIDFGMPWGPPWER